MGVCLVGHLSWGCPVLYLHCLHSQHSVILLHCCPRVVTTLKTAREAWEKLRSGAPARMHEPIDSIACPGGTGRGKTKNCRPSSLSVAVIKNTDPKQLWGGGLKGTVPGYTVTEESQGRTLKAGLRAIPCCSSSPFPKVITSQPQRSSRKRGS